MNRPAHQRDSNRRVVRATRRPELALKEALGFWGGISRPTVLRAEKARLLKLVRFGRRCFVPDAEVRRIAAHGLPSLNAWAGAGR